MTARDERVVWTVPGAAADPPDNVVSTFRAGFCLLILYFPNLAVIGKEGIGT